MACYLLTIGEHWRTSESIGLTEKKSFFLSLFMILLTLSSLGVVSLGEVLPAGVRVYLNPSISTATPGQEFTVKVSVAEATSLYAWQFFLRWNSTILTCVNLTEGSFLNQEETRETQFVPSVDNERGEINVATTLVGSAEAAASGSGVLAVVTFSVKMEGKTTLHFVPYAPPQEPGGTKLLRWTGMDFERITPTLEDGYFSYPLPKFFVYPSSIINPLVSSGSTLTIRINVSEVSGVYAWQFFLYWNPSILELELAGVTEDTFLSQSGAQPTTFYKEINQTGSYVYVNCTLVGSVPTASGNGTLAVLNFVANLRGSTILNLDETKLVDVDGEFIPHDTLDQSQDGYFSNAAHDVAVTNIVVSSTSVKAGDSVSINVTVINYGVMTETFDVTVSTPSPTYYKIGTQRVTDLESGQEKTLAFIWNTAGVSEGDYSIKAEASTVPEEANIQNNSFVMTGKVTVSVAGQSLSTVLIIGAVVAVVAVGAGVFVYTRRRSKS